LKQNALMSLALAGDPLALSEALELAQADDKGSRIHAMILLSRIEGEEADAALVQGLADGELEVRANAAIALAGKSDPRSAEVLIELIDPATIARERERDPKRFAAEDAPRDVRTTAVTMLGRLGRPEDLELLRSIATGDEDLEVRKAAAEALEAGRTPAER
jgi:HEAT repeat protein